MFQLQAPYPALQTTSVLPNPEFGDGENLANSVTAKRAMDGTLRTYIKRKNGRRKLSWSFVLTRNKGQEVREFIRSYYASKIRVTDHNGRVWVGNFISDPFEFDTPQKAGPTIGDWPVGEKQTITIEFEGMEQ